MAIISQSHFDKSVAHTIRIELKDGSTLIYRVSVEAKAAFYKFLQQFAQLRNFEFYSKDFSIRAILSESQVLEALTKYQGNVIAPKETA